MRADESCRSFLADGFKSIRTENHIPEGDAGTEELRAVAADVAIDGGKEIGRRDATDIEFVTLDPASSTDLDQAFSVSSDGDDIVLHYAIADIGAFVARGSDLEAEAWRRGVTVYAPDGSVPLYPRVLSQKRASLLPDGPRPAVLLTVAVAPDGMSTLRTVERVFAQSRAKLAYETTTDANLSPLALELSKRIAAAEEVRGAFRVERPAQEVVRDETSPGGMRLQFTPRLLSEDRNAGLSLAANLAVARFMLDHGLGLFRVMDEPDEQEVVSLRRRAKVLGLNWTSEETLHHVVSRIDQANAKHVAFAVAVRRAGGGARYEVFSSNAADNKRADDKIPAVSTAIPWHAAMAATYAHATAPMRRLADRYVLDLLVAQASNDHVTIDALRSVLSDLSVVMETSEHRASKVDRDSIGLVECSVLEPLIGSRLPATVIDVEKEGLQIQIDEPAILARVRPNSEHRSQPGDLIAISVDAVDRVKRTTHFTVVKA